MKYARILAPLAFGLAAGLLNFFAMRGALTTVEVVVALRDIKPGERITGDMLGKASVRVADPQIFKSVMRYKEHGMLIGRIARRPIRAGEVVLYGDFPQAGGNFAGGSQPGNAWGIAVKPDRLDPDLREGEAVTSQPGPATGLSGRSASSVSPSRGTRRPGSSTRRRTRSARPRPRAAAESASCK